MLLAAFLLVTIVVPVAVARALRRTRAWWGVGVIVAAFGAFLLATLDHGDHHGDDGMGAWYDIGNAMQKAYGVFMFVFAAVLLLASHAGRKAARQPRPGSPPV